TGSSQKVSTVYLAKNARYDSQKREKEPFCSPGTRIDVLRDIDKWIEDENAPAIFWLSGLAGAGKSTISRTVARDCAAESRLAANFCFSMGDGGANSADLFATTISHQLAGNMWNMKEHLASVRAGDQLLPCQGLLRQWETLVLEPLSRFYPGFWTSMLIVIDGLDSCQDDNDIRLIIRLLSKVHEASHGRMRILLTSRPESVIRSALSGIDHREFRLEDNQRGIIDSDLRVFYSDEMKNIAQTVEGLNEDWPGDETISKLVQKAEGLFLWAATACQYLRDGRKKGFILRRLDDIMEGCTTKGSPQDKVNQTYAAILKRSVSNHWTESEISTHNDTVNDILAAMCIVQAPVSVKTMEILLPQDDIEATVRDLQSIIMVPDDAGKPV
ncbi:hypothetical protein BO94DRAFT_442969, partial [Aspergillus sclerotioniger CBS 115572]